MAAAASSRVTTASIPARRSEQYSGSSAELERQRKGDELE